MLLRSIKPVPPFLCVGLDINLKTVFSSRVYWIVGCLPEKGHGWWRHALEITHCWRIFSRLVFFTPYLGLVRISASSWYIARTFHWLQIAHTGTVLCIWFFPAGFTLQGPISQLINACIFSYNLLYFTHRNQTFSNSAHELSRYDVHELYYDITVNFELVCKREIQLSKVFLQIV